MVFVTLLRLLFVLTWIPSERPAVADVESIDLT
jgi:hypothetical protein